MNSDAVHRQVERELRAFVGQDRGVAYSYLAWLGLRYFSKVYPDHALELELLKRLIGNLSGDLEESLQQGRNAQSFSKGANHERKGRLDAMAHYPFADQSGSVPDVLQGGNQEKPNLLAMGIPGRKRFVEKVFNEMRFDRGGIRLSDIPEALDRLGIDISAELRRILERARSKNTDGPLDREEDEDEREYFALHYREKYITLHMWKQVVSRFLTLLRQGKDTSKLGDILPHIHRAYAADDGRDGEGDYEDDYWDEDESNDPYDYYGQGEAKRVVSSSERDGKHHQHHNNSSVNHHPHSRQHSRAHHPRRSPLQQHAQQYLRKIHGVHSRIGDFVRSDRDRFVRRQRGAEREVKNYVGTLRAERFMEDVRHAGAEMGRGVGQDWQDGMRRVSERRAEARGGRAGWTRDGDVDLSSGHTARDIADAFLSGPLARELLWSEGGEVEYREEALSPKNAQLAAAQLLGLRPSFRPTSAAATSSRTANLSAQTTASHGSGAAAAAPMGFKPYSQHQREKQLEEEGRKVYQAPARQTRGGWVADFGPPHTHKLYTGPDKHRASLRDRAPSPSPPSSVEESKVPLFEDAMMVEIARDLAREEQEDSPSSAPYSTRSSAHLAQNKDKAQPPAQNTHSAPSYPPSASSRQSARESKALESVLRREDSPPYSVDTATLGAGAGVLSDWGGSRGGEESSMQLDEDLLSRLQHSVALKDAVRK